LTLTLAENIANGLQVNLKDLFDFDHKAEEKQLKADLKIMIESANGEHLQLLHRIIRSTLI